MTNLLRLTLVLTLLAGSSRAEDLVLRNVRIFDATGAAPGAEQSVHVRGGRIVEVGRNLDAGGATVLDGSGATVLPGLIDSHVHFVTAPGGGFRRDSDETIRQLNRRHLRAYLACGVTTVLEPGGHEPVIRAMQAGLAAGDPGPRYLTTGPYLRVPGAYGSELHFGTDATPEAIEAKLDLIASLGGVGVKLGIEAGWAEPEGELLAALQAGMKRRGLPLYVHATTEADQSRALDLGARALVHAPLCGRWRGELSCRDLSDAYVAKLAKSGAYQLTTLHVIDVWPGRFDAASLAAPLLARVVPAIELDSARDPASDRYFAVSTIGWAAPWVPEVLRPWIGRALWTRDSLDEGMRYSQRNVKRLFDAGVPLVAATDAPSPWDGSSTHFHGPGMLREVELLVEAGIPPAAALIAATRTPAEMLGLAGEIGTIEPGKRADLLIVDGDPLVDVRALRRIRWVVRDGELRTPEGWME